MSTGEELVKLKHVNEYYKDLRKRSAPVIINSASGNPIVITDGADGLPIQSLKLNLLPRQSGSGDASPENVRPLVPWENVGMWQACVNVWDEEVELGGINSTTGIGYTSTTAIRAKNYIPVVPGASYYMVSPTSSCTGCWYDKNKNYISTRYITNQVMTAPSNAYFFRFDLPSSYGTTYNHDISINYPSTDTEYHPYTGQSHPVDLTGITPPIYGGTLDLTTGEVLGTWADKAVSETRPEKKADYIFQFYFSDRKYGQGLFGIISDSYKTHTNVASTGSTIESLYAQYGDGIYINSGSGTFYICDSNYTDVDDFKTAMADAKIAYELSTPILLATLTSEEITTLLGTNTIWSDADSIDVEYRADTGLFINQNSVKDVQVNEESILDNGIANIPLGNYSTAGLIRIQQYGGLQLGSGMLKTDAAGETLIKSGANTLRPIVPGYQHMSAFYGLAKVAGADMAQSSNAVGTYTDAAKQGIQKLFGLEGLLGPYEDDITADQAYAIGDTFVMDGKRYKVTAAIAQGGIITPGTNCELDPLDGRYISNTDYATVDKAGVVKAAASYGTFMQGAILGISKASDTNVKDGTHQCKPIVPYNQHASVFYALSKAAGVDLASSDTPVGTYTAEAKAAILAMLGAVGTTDIASANDLGVVKINNNYGSGITDGQLYVVRADSTAIKAGSNGYKPITPSLQHESVYYALSKLAGVDLASGSDTVGVYPQNAKDAIQSMLGIETGVNLVEEITSATPTITASPNVRYKCGEVSLLTLTPPSAGSCEVIFESGSTPTVLSLPNTVKFPEWFDATALEADTIYDIIITDGVYGSVMSWAN